MTIELFANSGHQYCFVPLDQEYLKSNPGIVTKCEHQKDPWKQYKKYKWIRYRYGTQNYVSGFWLCVDSNLGSNARGFVYQPARAVPPSEIAIGVNPNQTPYAAIEERNLPKDLDLTFEGTEKIVLLWMKPNGKPVDVDLIVDFGNTRTVALLLEHNHQIGDLRQICYPVRFTPRATPYEAASSFHSADDPLAIVDSWIILHEPVFSEFQPPSPNFTPETVVEFRDREAGLMERWRGGAKTVREIIKQTKYVPQMFVELSPALFGGGVGLGTARDTLTQLDLSRGGNFFLSSPKRYAWDNDEVGPEGLDYWNEVLNGYSKPDPAQLPRLRGPVLMLMDTDGRDWDVLSPPNERTTLAARPHPDPVPTHPRSDALTWVALGVIERAYSQLSSAAYRKLLNSPYIPRRLRSVLVTFPAGWTGEELKCYLGKWQKAINIFTLGHLQNRELATHDLGGGERPELVTNLDEAVASQLPVIHSEMLRLPGGESWIELVGRGNLENARVRVMNLDIGGGTTDVSIVEYGDLQPGPGVHLEANLLFKNSNTIAGDALVLRIIQSILLPKLAENLNLTENGSMDLLIRFKEFFGHPTQQMKAKDPALRQKMSRITRLAFIPIVNFWLKQQSEETGKEPISPSKMKAGDGSPMVEPAIIAQLNKLGKEFITPKYDLLPYETSLYYDSNEVRKCVREEFKPLIQSLTKLVVAFNCDLAIVSGKPSELPEIRNLLCQYLPLLPQRIISVKNFPAGGWYPLGSGDKTIRDAKTITAVGAALYQAMINSLVPDWNLTCKHETIFSENYWGRMPDAKRPEEFDERPLLIPGQPKNTDPNMTVGTCIGRKRFLSKYVLPDQIYKLRWKRGRQQQNFKPTLKVTLGRKREENAVESLELLEVSGLGRDKEPITLDDIELQLCTLANSNFWIDDPHFEVNLSK